jgi:hypothetical protein
VFKLAWHGYMLMLMLFVTTFLFTWQITAKSRGYQGAEMMVLKKARSGEHDPGQLHSGT